MKPIKLLLGLVSSLLLAVGLTKAAEIVDPLAGRLAAKRASVLSDTAPYSAPCAWADTNGLTTKASVLTGTAAYCCPCAWAITNR